MGRVLTNFVSPDSLGTMLAYSTAAEALPALAGLPGVAAKLKDLPTVIKALDVTTRAAVPAIVAGKGAADIAARGVPDNYEDAVETAANALIVGAGVFGADTPRVQRRRRRSKRRRPRPSAASLAT